MSANQQKKEIRTCKVCKQAIYKKMHAAIVAWVTEPTANATCKKGRNGLHEPESREILPDVNEFSWPS